MRATKPFYFLLLATFFSVKAQSQTAPDWTVDVGGFISGVNFIRQSDVGTLIVSTNTKLVGIDPRTKGKAWETTEVKDIKDDEFKVISGTQYIMVEFQKQTSLAKNKTVAIFDSYTGKMVYNSRDEDIKVRNTRVVPELGGLMIEAVKESQYFIGFLDFASSQVSWTKSFGKVKTGGIGIGALKRAIKSHLESVFDVEPVVDAAGNFIFSNKEMVYCVDGKTGRELWTKEFKNDITDFILSPDKKDLFVVYDDLMDRAEAATGKNVYAKPIKLEGKVNGLMPLNDATVIMHSDGFNVLEANGSLRWKKDASVGDISSVWVIPGGFIALESDDDEAKIIKVSSDGKKQWSESLSDPVYTVEPIANGVIYITTEKANILSYEKGKDVWKKDIKIKGNPAFGIDRDKHVVYVYSDKALSSFDLNSGTYKEVVEELKLKDYDDDKELANLETRNGGLFIQTNQNVAFIKEDGTVLYNKYFTEAGLSKGARGLLKAAGVAASVGGTAYGLAGLSKPENLKFTKIAPNTYEVTSKQLAAGGTIAQSGDALYSFAQARYFATQSAKNTVYVLSKWNEGTGLVVVDKDNGEEIKRIVFNDKTPQYVVDEADYKVYVIVKDKELRAYSLKK
jgi:outer membrane protein assembly factor BamB